jgi:hypothetical protein
MDNIMENINENKSTQSVAIEAIEKLSQEIVKNIGKIATCTSTDTNNKLDKILRILENDPKLSFVSDNTETNEKIAEITANDAYNYKFPENINIFEELDENTDDVRIHQIITNYKTSQTGKNSDDTTDTDTFLQNINLIINFTKLLNEKDNILKKINIDNNVHFNRLNTELKKLQNQVQQLDTRTNSSSKYSFMRGLKAIQLSKIQTAVIESSAVVIKTIYRIQDNFNIEKEKNQEQLTFITELIKLLKPVPAGLYSDPTTYTTELNNILGIKHETEHETEPAPDPATTTTTEPDPATTTTTAANTTEPDPATTTDANTDNTATTTAAEPDANAPSAEPASAPDPANTAESDSVNAAEPNATAPDSANAAAANSTADAAPELAPNSTADAATAPAPEPDDAAPANAPELAPNSTAATESTEPTENGLVATEVAIIEERLKENGSKGGSRTKKKGGGKKSRRNTRKRKNKNKTLKRRKFSRNSKKSLRNRRSKKR